MGQWSVKGNMETALDLGSPPTVQRTRILCDVRDPEEESDVWNNAAHADIRRAPFWKRCGITLSNWNWVRSC